MELYINKVHVIPDESDPEAPEILTLVASTGVEQEWPQPQEKQGILLVHKNPNASLAVSGLPPGIPIGEPWGFWESMIAHDVKNLFPSLEATPFNAVKQRIVALGWSSQDVADTISEMCDADVLAIHKKVAGSKIVALDSYNTLCECKEVVDQILEMKQMNILIAAYALLTKEQFKAASVKELIDLAKGTLNRNQWAIFLALPPLVLRRMIHYVGADYNVIQETCRILDSSEIPIQAISNGKIRVISEMVHLYSQGYLDDELIKTYKAFAKHVAKSATEEEKSLRRKVNHTEDFIRETRVTPAQVNRWGLEGCNNRSRQWHENLAIGRGGVQRTYTKGITWDCGITTQTIDDYRIVPLNSSDELGIEGQIMQHCVGGYHNKCSSGLSVIFSVRNIHDGERVATLELINRNGLWVKQTLNGPRNRSVKDSIIEACNEFTDYYNMNNTRDRKKEN